MKKIVMLFLAILTLTVVYIRDGVDGVARTMRCSPKYFLQLSE